MLFGGVVKYTWTFIISSTFARGQHSLIVSDYVVLGSWVGGQNEVRDAAAV